MKKIILIICIASSIYTMPIDKAYVFTQFTQDEKDNKNYEAKIAISKTIDMSDTSFVFIEGTKSIKYNQNEDTIKSSALKELYYDKYFLNDLFNLRIGRSIKAFDFTNTYSVVDFLSSSSNVGDINDRALNKNPLDGMSFTMNDITNEETSQYITIHTYIDDISDKDKSDNQKYLFEMTQSNDKVHQSIFIFNNNQDYPSLAIAKSQTIGDKINFNATARYDFTPNDDFSSVTGIEYNPNDKFLLGLESITLTKNIEGRNERMKKHSEFRSANDFNNYYKDLTSKVYLSMYSQYKWNDTSLTFNWLENLNDSSRRLSTQVNHKFETIEVNLQANNFQGRESTEFGYIEEQKAYEIKFFVSYLWVE